MDRPANAGARGAPTADPAKVPSWNKPDAASLESAAREQRPIVLYFPAEKDSDFDIYGDDWAQLSKEDALFIKVPYTADREKSPWSENSVIPTNKLLSPNPSLEYGIAVGKADLLVCDWFGNKYFAPGAKIKADALKALIGKVKDEADKADKKLAKTLEKAQQQIEKKDDKGAVKSLLSNFKTGYYGLPSQEASVKLYREIMDAGRERIKEMHEKGDTEGLKGIAKDYKGTDLEKEANEALKNPNTQGRKG